MMAQPIRPTCDQTLRSYQSKAAARIAVWDTLLEKNVARFPFPPHHRIPNFNGAKEAAEALFEESPWSTARHIKVNPDAPQRYLRELALRKGIVLFVPTPRLRGGFFRVDPANIPQDKLRDAASLSKGARWATPVSLGDLPQLDAIVTGSVAVTTGGKRCGKGEGYADLEYAILQELGHPPVPVATTVHDLQVVEAFPTDPTDLPLSLIVTPTRRFRIEVREITGVGIDWDRLPNQRLEEMPVLNELKRLARPSFERAP